MTVRRALDFVIYIALSVAVLFSIAWCAEHNIGSEQGLVRWGGLAGSTVVLFWYFVETYKRLLKRWTFWAVLLGLLTVRLLAFIAILSRASEWRVVWWGILLPLEIVVFVLILSVTGHNEFAIKRR
jgi:hypothetical protein